MEWAALTVTLLYVVSVSIFVSSYYSVLLSCNLQKPNGMCLHWNGKAFNYGHHGDAITKAVHHGSVLFESMRAEISFYVFIMTA